MCPTVCCKVDTLWLLLLLLLLVPQQLAICILHLLFVLSLTRRGMHRVCWYLVHCLAVDVQRDGRWTILHMRVSLPTVGRDTHMFKTWPVARL
jgi:hypothetical protein